ncbi:MAG: hypothetical protein COB23_06020 [Methylophaga sp.]|nr:MAG: hypothetical protein COB23_06020 [Methylophaga sp.]
MSSNAIFNYSNTTVNIVSALFGANKSHALGQHIKQYVQTKSHLVVLVSCSLIEQFYADLKSAGLRSVKKTGSDNFLKGKVKSSITKFSRNTGA